MDKNEFEKNASDSWEYVHLYLRGNFQGEMFYDKVDKINAWNRSWLSAFATGVEIMAVNILGNHLHICARVRDDLQRANFKHHYRLSLTQYHNNRYKVKGTLGTRRFKHGVLKGLLDAVDCICYIVRNVLHHGISKNFMDYQFTTAKYVFGLQDEKQKGVYTNKNLPPELEAYLPKRVQLPDGWMMTAEGMIVPPAGVFRGDLIEEIFGTKENYLAALSQRTNRERDDREEPEGEIRNYASDSRKIQDEQVVEFVKANCRIPIPAMNRKQRMSAIYLVVDEFPQVNLKLLSRLFEIPYTTLIYRLEVRGD